LASENIKEILRSRIEEFDVFSGGLEASPLESPSWSPEMKRVQLFTYMIFSQ
jgi:hypothetical protein